MKQSKPKDIVELAKEDFQAYLERTSRSPKTSVAPPKSNTLKPRTKPPEFNPETNSFKALFSPKTESLLNNFTDEQKRLIGKVWRDMLDLFGNGKLRQEFGDEPSSRFMVFATSLTQESYTRLINNLTERLNEDKDWPPSLERFKQLKDLPSELEVQDARRRLLIESIRIEDCNRVEAYIKKHKKMHIRALSERNLEIEFKRLYQSSFRDVLFDIDITKDKQQEEVSKIINQEHRTSNDVERDAYQLTEEKLNRMGTVGDRLKRILNRENMIEEITPVDPKRAEQEKLAKQIIQALGDEE